MENLDLLLLYLSVFVGIVGVLLLCSYFHL